MRTRPKNWLEKYIDVSYYHYQATDHHEYEQHYSKLTDAHARQKAFANNIANNRTQS